MLLLLFSFLFSYNFLQNIPNAQYKHDPKDKAVRMQDQLTEVKQPRPWLILAV